MKGGMYGLCFGRVAGEIMVAGYQWGLIEFLSYWMGFSTPRREKQTETKSVA